MRNTLAALILILTALPALAEVAPHPAGTLQIPSEITSADCAAQGGTETQINGPECVFPTRDGGKACTDSSQCEGTCATDDASATAGQCTGTIDPMGCYSVVTKGHAEEKICRD